MAEKTYNVKIKAVFVLVKQVHNCENKKEALRKVLAGGDQDVEGVEVLFSRYLKSTVEIE